MQSKTLVGLSLITQAFMEHNSFLKKFLGRFLPAEQDIEDVAQEAYLKAFSAEQDKGEIDQPKAFLFSIAKNIALNELNRKSRQMTGYIEDCQEADLKDRSGTLESEINALQVLGVYCEAVASLPEACRRVYLLRKVHGLPHKEIAQRLSVSLSTVEKHLCTGVLSCRDYMHRKGYEYPPSAIHTNNKRAKAAVNVQHTQRTE